MRGAPPSGGSPAHDEYYVVAPAERSDVTRVLKHGDTFGVFDRHGDVLPGGLGEQGLYHAGTRYLSRLELRLGGRRPALLSSSVMQDGTKLAIDLTNPDLEAGGVEIPRGTVHVFRCRFLWHGVAHEQLRITNYGGAPVELVVSCRIEADFADVFEVRGMRRARRGRRLPARRIGDALVLAYDGLDGVTRAIRIDATPAPDRVAEGQLTWRLRLGGKEERRLLLRFGCALAAEPAPVVIGYDAASEQVGAAMAARRAGEARISTSNRQFDAWLDQSVHDLHVMLTDLPAGAYPYAGIPWYCAPFGRDGLVTALASLWAAPHAARGVLGLLADTQATRVEPERDAEPGKILHELRAGEMAALGEIPFERYYGTADATALFVIVAAHHHRRTADAELAHRLWPHVEAALAWHDEHGDRDGDGFVEYHAQTPRGLAHQGWKDSHDAVSHADGRLAAGPIALCEVQAYWYAALRGGAALARAVGRDAVAARLDERAAALRHRFDERFWDDELGSYVLALDGDKRPCRVRASNAGQCLFTGIVPHARAVRIAAAMLGPELYSGWGVRTLGAGEARFNPMSYHNGSVWPHDNALIALGLARHGLTREALVILGGLFEASTYADQHRLPELFCGFVRRPGEGPTDYPVACAPQAWAAAAVLMLLEACLGLTVDACHARVTFAQPALPPFLQWVRITDLRVGAATLDVTIHRHASDVGVVVERRDGDVDVVVWK